MSHNTKYVERMATKYGVTPDEIKGGLTYDRNGNWTNYGDVHPEEHGGRFIRWESDMWHVIETTHKSVLPEGFLSGDETHLIQHHWIEPMDLFEGGKPENGPTEAMQAVLDSFSIDMVEALGPDYDDIRYFVVNIPHHIGRTGRDEYTGDFWGYLESYGITKEETPGVSN